MRDLDVNGMASLVYARVEPEPDPDGGRTLLWTNAGHPPPLLVAADGAVECLDDGVPDLFVGVLPATDRVDQRSRITPGSTLLLYTDGLVERRGEDITAGLDRLADARPDATTAWPLEGFVDAVLGDLVGDRLARRRRRARGPPPRIGCWS